MEHSFSKWTKPHSSPSQMVPGLGGGAARDSTVDNVCVGHGP